MKTFIVVLVLLSVIINLSYSQKQKTYDISDDRGMDITDVSKDDIKNKKTPEVSFSLDNKKGVSQEFLLDEFVKALLSIKGAKIHDEGDISFDVLNKEDVGYEYSLKDDDEYNEYEIENFKKLADSYYEFKDFDAYEDYYYYYDVSTLEKYKIDKEFLSSKVFSLTNYAIAKISKVFQNQVFLNINPYLNEALNYYSDGLNGFNSKNSNLKYDISKAAGINKSLIEEALTYYRNNKNIFNNNRFMAVLEFNKHSAKSRFYIINLNKMAVVAAYHVSHGVGSDKNNDGYATYFSNQPGSKASSLGIYKTGEIYSGKYGKSLRLHGLSPTNSNVYKRAIVIHPSPYVKEANVKPGRSWGCMAFDYKVSGDVINMLRNGALIYAKYTR